MSLYKWVVNRIHGENSILKHKIRAYVEPRRDPEKENERRQLADGIIQDIPDDEKTGFERKLAGIRAGEMGYVVDDLYGKLMAAKTENHWLKQRIVDLEHRTPATNRHLTVRKSG